VCLFELFLVIILAKAAEQFRGARDGASIETGGIGTNLRDRFDIDEKRAAQHAVFPHQILDRTDFVLFDPLLLLSRECRAEALRGQ
jgi:hypothetical protein